MPPSIPPGPSRRAGGRAAITSILFATAALSYAAPASAQSAQPAPPIGYYQQPQPTQTWGYTPNPEPFVPAQPRGATADQVPEKKKEPRATDSMAFDVALVTEAPIMMGGQATFEMPYRFLLQGEVGVVPGFFVDAVDGALKNAGAYDDATSQVVRGGLRNSLIVRLSGGWRPFPDHGFEILGGYTMTSLGAGVSGKQAVEAASGISIPAEIPDGDVVIHSTIHSVHVSLGWRWVIANHFLIRASVGYMQGVASSSHLEVPASLSQNPTTAAYVSQANTAVDSFLDDKFKTYVKLPVLGLSMGYRF